MVFEIDPFSCCLSHEVHCSLATFMIKGLFNCLAFTFPEMPVHNQIVKQFLYNEYIDDCC